MTKSKQIAPIEEIRHSLTKMESQFQAALPAHIDPKKFVRVAVTAIQTNPDLQAADRTSLYASCTRAAQDGLLPDGREAALVIFNTNKGSKQSPQWVKAVQYMPMIAGVLKKLRNSGQLSSITAQVVHKNDKFSYRIDSDGEHLMFEPDMFSDRGEPIGAFAMAKLTDGALYVEVMTKQQIEAVRAVSRAAGSGPWASWWDEMAKKSALRRLSKRLPMSSDLDEMFAREEADYERVVAADTSTADDRPMQDVTPEPEPKKQRQTRARAAVESNPGYTVEEIQDPEPQGQSEQDVPDAEYEEIGPDEVPI